MKKIQKILRGRKQLVFLDLEGTQFSHEIIALGAVKAIINEDGTLKKIYPGFKLYITAKNSVGKVVEEMTGITDSFLKTSGISFDEALPQFKKYVGSNFSKTKFVVFGTHDLRILRQSLIYTPEADHNLVKTIIKNNLDLNALISEFIKDENNNTLSLVNLCKFFNIPPLEPAHDPLNDALMLSYLYSAMLKEKELIKESYTNVILNAKGVPNPVRRLIHKLRSGESVTKDDLMTFVEEEIE